MLSIASSRTSLVGELVSQVGRPVACRLCVEKGVSLAEPLVTALFWPSRMCFRRKSLSCGVKRSKRHHFPHDCIRIHYSVCSVHDFKLRLFCSFETTFISPSVSIIPLPQSTYSPSPFLAEPRLNNAARRRIELHGKWLQ